MGISIDKGSFIVRSNPDYMAEKDKYSISQLFVFGPDQVVLLCLGLEMEYLGTLPSLCQVIDCRESPG